MRYDTKISDAAYFGLDRPVKTRMCDCAGCAQPGDYRAPKNRELSEYYWFCLDHVREYNLNWDYYAGMSEAQIEAQIKYDTCWQRDTRPLGGWKKREDEVREKAARDFFEEENEAAAQTDGRRHHLPAAAVLAMAVLELKPPADFSRIKAHYKKLVKKHHPDANGGSVEAEEKFKTINQAFATLKKMHEAGEA